MRTFLYTAGDPVSHKKIGSSLSELPAGDYVIIVKKNRPIRSLQANKFYHAVMKLYATHTGHTMSEIENMFKMERHFEIVYYPSGKTEKIPRDTHDLDTKEFTAMCNNLLQWGRDNFPEVIVPRQEDLTYRQWIEIDNEYNKTFSGF